MDYDWILSDRNFSIGEVRLATGDTAGALGIYDRAFEVRELLAAGYPKSAAAPWDLSASLASLGDVRLRTVHTVAQTGIRL